jgi:hypothetical protein
MKLRLLAVAAAMFCAVSGTAFGESGNGDKNGQNDATKKIQAGSFSPRVFVRNEYRSNQDGSYMNFLVPLVEVPLGELYSLRTEVPVITRNPRIPGTDADTGIGDIVTRLSRTVLTGEGYAMVFGLEYTFDSATEDSLGSGKQILSPVIYGSVRVPKLNSILFPLAQYYESVGGDDARPDVRQTVIKPMALTRLPNRFYTFVEPAVYIDHEHNDRVGVTLEVEAGRFVNPQTMVYLRPGAGLVGDDMPQIFNWNFEVGFRYFFK